MPKPASERQRQRLAVMESSGQTDAQRRNLRQSLRTLHKTIKGKAEELEDATSSSFATMRNQNNSLWDQVRYTREAVLDGDNLDFLATRAARQVDKLVEVRTLLPSRVSRGYDSHSRSHVFHPLCALACTLHPAAHHYYCRFLGTMPFAYPPSSNKSFRLGEPLTGRSSVLRLAFASTPFLPTLHSSPVHSTLTILPKSERNMNVVRKNPTAITKKKNKNQKMSKINRRMRINYRQWNRTFRLCRMSSGSAASKNASALPNSLTWTTSSPRRDRESERLERSSTCSIPNPLLKLSKTSFISPFSSKMDVLVSITQTTRAPSSNRRKLAITRRLDNASSRST